MGHVCAIEKQLGCDIECLFFLAGLFGPLNSCPTLPSHIKAPLR